jgi:hypothetical protein
VRKGGIIEESGDFDLRSRTFLLQPTYAHQTERSGDIQSRYAAMLEQEELSRADASVVRFEAACEVVDVIRVKDADALIGLSSEHIWSEQFLRGRFEWEPYKPVSVLVVRAYLLSEPIEVAFEPEYGGCKSWSELSNPVPTAGATAAIADSAEFERQLSNVRDALAA